MPASQGTISVVLSIEDSTVLAQYMGLVESDDRTSTQQRRCDSPVFTVKLFRTLDDACNSIDRLFSSVDGAGAILVSDQLVHEALKTVSTAWELTSVADEIRSKYAKNLFAMVAVMHSPSRIPNIDLALPDNCSPEEWSDALTVLCERLNYFARPLKRDRPSGIEVRPIRNQIELYESYRLRYIVYRIMGYLNEMIQNTGTHLEVHWCDTISLHFGAFVKAGGRDELIGTSRLILTEPIISNYRGWTRSIVDKNPALEHLFELQRQLYAQWKLPIFHTLKQLNEDIRDVALGRKIFGELSRVIVAPKWRGIGLSHDLVQAAIEAAREKGVDTLLLECLEIHEDFYRQQFAFESMGYSSEVLSIGKTMVGMVRKLTVSESAT